MKTAVENLEPTKVKVTVEVPYAELKPEMDKVYKDFARQINVPGFRPGKAPAAIIDQRIGRGPVIEETINNSLSKFFGQAIEEHNLTPLGRPEVDVTKTPNIEGPAGGDLEIVITVEVAPEFELPELSKIKLEVEPVEVTDEDVNAELDQLRARFASLKTVERAIKDKDFVVLDMKAEIDGKEIDSVSQVSYQIGSGNMLDGMDEALKGMKAGKTKTFKAPLAGGEHAGEEADVTVTPTAVKEQELPAADDEFAQLVSEHDTIEEFLKDLREDVTRGKTAEQAVAARNLLLEALVEKVDFPLPSGVIEEAVASSTGEDATDEEKAEKRAAAEKELRSQLVMDKLAVAKEVTVSQPELLEFVLQTSQAYGIDPSSFLSNAERQGRLPAFIQEIARNKALAVSLREVSVKDKNGKEIDLSEFIGSDEEDKAAEGEEEAAEN